VPTRFTRKTSPHKVSLDRCDNTSRKPCCGNGGLVRKNKDIVCPIFDHESWHRLCGINYFFFPRSFLCIPIPVYNVIHDCQSVVCVHHLGEISQIHPLWSHCARGFFCACRRCFKWCVHLKSR